MPNTNNVVQIVAGLLCSRLVAPPIGVGQMTAATGYTDGDPAQDKYVVLNGTTPVALNSDLGGTGFIMVNNPSPYDVTLKSGATTIGTLKGQQTVNGVVDAPQCCVFPIDSGVVINAVTTAAQTPTVGVTVIKTTNNQ